MNKNCAKKKKSIPPIKTAGMKKKILKKTVQSRLCGGWTRVTRRFNPAIWNGGNEEKDKKKKKWKWVILKIFFQRGSDLKFFLQIGSEKKNFKLYGRDHFIKMTVFNLNSSISNEQPRSKLLAFITTPNLGPHNISNREKRTIASRIPNTRASK